MNPLETYLEEISLLRASGSTVKETSGYGALANLLNAVGQTLRPKVRCLIQLKNSGAGLPDGGLFTPDQLKNPDEEAPLLGQKPARGIIEVKGATAELADIAGTKQVKAYLVHYGQVLLTNYRDFLLLERDPGGAMLQLESFRLAESETAFWAAAAHPRKTSAALGERFTEYLKRVLLHAAPLNNPRDVAFFLASYARDARARVEAAGDLPALTAIRTALEEALGMKFEAAKGEHFFRSTLVQTLFYGVFSAWVLWHKQHVGQASRLSPSSSGPEKSETGATPVLQFDWRAAAWTLHVPMIKALFEQVATPTKLGPLGLVEVLDWTAAALNRVDRPAFFEKFLETHAVQYFYEPFLGAFDPDLRKELGVWYTPPEIVQYQVARVDAVLREELGRSDGLADKGVYVLDPCCGTGAYLVEVLRRIVKTLTEEQGETGAALATAKDAAMRRVYGFEIMPAPFVVAHLQMGLLLQSLGVALDDSKGERAGIFLTNSLTGWDFSGENPQLKNWPELQEERAGAGRVKQESKILVILGNPPYNAFAGVSPEEEQGLVEPYKSELISKWGIKKFNLDDLYVRFFRLAERKIAERTGQGVVCFISNFSYLADPSFVVMRQRFLQEFDKLWFDCLNGDSRETGKLTPEGKPDPSVFSTDFNREGIRVGTAVGLMVRKPEHGKKSQAFFRQFWGVNKRADILESLKVKKFAKQYERVGPNQSNRFSFCPSEVARQYYSWPRVPEFCAEPPSNGLMEKRGGALMAFDRHALETRMRQYYDPDVSLEHLKAIGSALAQDAARFDARKAREKVLAAEEFQPDHLRRYALRPFDVRWCYYSAERPLWNEPRPKLWAQCWKGNAFLLTRMNCSRTPEGAPVCFTTCLCDDHFLTPDAVAIPFRLRADSGAKAKRKDDGNGEFGSILHEAAPAYGGGGGKTTANLSPAARDYLAKLGLKNPDADADTAALIWLHALAIGFAPAYLAENADGIRQDWPRIPLPDSKKRLLASAELGRQVAALLDTEAPVPGVTDGKVRPELKHLADLRFTGEVDFRVTAGWGHAGKEGVTMPGKGKMLTRGYRPEEEAAFGVGQSSRLSPSLVNPEKSEPGVTPVLRLLGKSTHDIYLNDTAYWRNVPEKVWEFTIGGYQVLKKWLSYREHELLGRPLTTDEAREVTHTARRLAALLLLQPELDANYQRIKASACCWSA
ncbi:MAG: N-6 DNA methylase [Verrucomicrobia bacterium]|nr:N-6 DNA methylase [Verrucomicrobiota bacterium]